MGFIKSVSKPLSKLTKGKSKNYGKSRSSSMKDKNRWLARLGVSKPISKLTKDKSKNYGKVRSSSVYDGKLRSTRDIKYMSAKASKCEKSDNVRVYTFSQPFEHKFLEEDVTISTASGSDTSSKAVETDPSDQYCTITGLQNLSMKQIEPCSSDESLISTPSESSYTCSSEDEQEVRDDVSMISNNTQGVETSNFDEEQEVRETIPPLLPPPRKYIPEKKAICSVMSNEEKLSDMSKASQIPKSAQVCELRNKSRPIREIRRNASEESRDYIHVFHLPLRPLDEENDSGDDADDESLPDVVSAGPITKRKGQQRRGSLSSTEDEIDLRQRWDYGLAMMAQMGLDTVSRKVETNNEDYEIKTLRCDDDYDRENAEEI